MIIILLKINCFKIARQQKQLLISQQSAKTYVEFNNWIQNFEIPATQN
jgi:hypothetical protein